MRPLRLFVAAYPPSWVAEALLSEAARFDTPGLRPVPAAQVHLTLVFIGNRAPRELEASLESVESSVRGVPAFELRPVRIVPLPRPALARSVVAETDRPPPLLEIHERLVRRFARDPSARPREHYRPHLTLGRFRGEVECELEVPLAIEPFPVATVAVIASDLRPDGAVHRAVATFTLDG